jgi:hypothetical protein
MKVLAIVIGLVVMVGFIYPFIKGKSVKNRIRPGTEPEPGETPVSPNE